MKWGRWWLSLTYLLATLLAQGVHDHSRGEEALAPESAGDCDESRVHIASHEAAPLGEPPSVCPSCQFRGQFSIGAVVTSTISSPQRGHVSRFGSLCDSSRITAPDPLPGPAACLIDVDGSFSSKKLRP